MLELTGMCCSGIEAIEFMESIAEIIDQEDKTTEFCDGYEKSLNRFRCQLSIT